MKDSSDTRISIRGNFINVDLAYEDDLGIYGKKFWGDASGGIYENNTFDFIQNCSESGYKIFLDVGAATGCMTLYAASLGMKVTSIEPQLQVFQALIRNIKLNPKLAESIDAQYALVVAGLRNSPRKDYFTPGAGGPISGGEISTQTVSLQHLLLNIPNVSRVAIKIDIEGAEFPLLANQDSIDSLRASKARLYLALHPGFSRPLSSKPHFIAHFSWRLLALADVIGLFSKCLRFGRIETADGKKRLNLFGFLLRIAKHEKEFQVQF